ncbi:hypothetical protein [Prosthecobacter sp.]|uniref:hypothetical protein n=1 Tax=Prosthecobacter sp. TaxID=1965333 RepID=UPI0037843B43
MRGIQSLAAFLGVAWLVMTGSSCAFRNQFRDVPRAQPHALVTVQPAAAFFDSGIGIFQLNEQPTSFWRLAEWFRVPPGPIKLHLVAGRNAYDYEPLGFVAKAGHHYDLRYGDTQSVIVLYDVSDTLAEPQMISRASRGDYWGGLRKNEHTPP